MNDDLTIPHLQKYLASMPVQGAMVQMSSDPALIPIVNNSPCIKAVYLSEKGGDKKNQIDWVSSCSRDVYVTPSGNTHYEPVVMLSISYDQPITDQLRPVFENMRNMVEGSVIFFAGTSDENREKHLSLMPMLREMGFWPRVSSIRSVFYVLSHGNMASS